MNDLEVTTAALLEARRIQDARSLRETSLKDFPVFVSQLGLATGPSEAQGHAWFDCRKNSPHRNMLALLDDTSLLGVGAFMPRGTGKSESVMLPWVALQIVKDPNVTVLLGSESQKLAVEKLTIVRGHLERLEEMGYGPFRTKQWSSTRFTVKRPMGIGGQATVTSWGPSVGGTGRHWKIGVFDDLYGELSADSPDIQRATTKRFIRIFGQKMPGTRIIVVGTMWPGRNTYYYKMHSDRAIKKYYKLLIYEERSQEGNLIFPWQTTEFLEQQKAEMGNALYRSQYKNMLVGEEELSFDARHFKAQAPPKGVPKVTYVLTDTAWSTTGQRHTSQSAIVVIQKIAGDTCYIVDLKLGRWDTTTFVRQLLETFETWRERGAPPEYYLMETQGSGGTYPGHISDAAKLLGVEPPKWVPVSHGMKAKNYRIALLRGPLESGRLLFSPTLPKDLFYVDDGGEPRGDYGEAFMAFSPEAKESFDGLDAIADAFVKDKDGNDLCPAPLKAKAKADDSLYARSLRAVRGSRRRYLR